MVDYFVLNDDNKRDPKELFKELAEKCGKEEKIKKEKIKEENKQTQAPKQNFV